MVAESECCRTHLRSELDGACHEDNKDEAERSECQSGHTVAISIR